MSLVLVYLAVHGFCFGGSGALQPRGGAHLQPGGHGHLLCVKTVLFAGSVALLWWATRCRDLPRHAATSVELQGLVQMFVLMLLIEIASLVGNYY
ncbi:MAG: hypothetical protein M9943_16530 [Burkholderiaceae bacterium]|nr:hypothetical protein [Burkholderiaceae bacterium]